MSLPTDPIFQLLKAIKPQPNENSYVTLLIAAIEINKLFP